MENTTTSNAGGGGGLGDILSMALLQTGVESVPSTQISLDSNSILNAAANTLDSSLLSTDINVLTEGLFSTLAMVKDSPSTSKPQALNTSTCSNNVDSATPNIMVSEETPTLGVTAPLPVLSTALPTVSLATTQSVCTDVASAGLAQPLAVVAPPTESEVKTAQLLKAELQNCMDDDIDLDELLSVGDQVNSDINQLSFLDANTHSDFKPEPSDVSVLLNPPTTSSDSSTVGSTSSTSVSNSDTSCLMSVDGSQCLKGMQPQLVNTRSNEENSEPAGEKSSVTPLNRASNAPSVVDLLATAGVTSTTPAPSLPVKTTTTTSPPPPTPSVTPSLTNITKPTTVTTSPNPTKPVLPTTKLDIAAILREITKMTPASIAASTSALTNTVKVTVVPSAAVANMMKAGGGLTPQTLVSLPGKVPLVARAPVTLAGQRGGDPLALQLTKTNVQPSQEQEEDSDEEDDQWAAIDTYANYRPTKLKLGYSHPDPIVESSSLSSVEPPQVWFDLKLPSHVVEEVQLSSLQLESVVYACQQHMNILSDGSRAGFLIGDGAGVGKGRTIAGIIYQNYLEGRKKAVWLSVSNDLKYDAIRDLRDVGAKKIDVYSLNKFHYGKISGKRNGRVRKGVIFSTYSSLIGESSSGGKYRTRLNQLLHWLGQFEGVIVFDECHKAKNLVPTGASKPSKTGLTVLQLQKKLPKARIVYCSATGASEPRNMAYMSRLGIWGPSTQFPAFHDFIKAVERRGVGAMEIVAMDMKLRGMYTARQLSFTGVTFDIRDVPLSEKFIEMYDSSVEMWVEAKRLFQEAADLMDYDRKKLKTMWGQFWAAHQRFFKYLCIAAKVPEVILLAKRGVADGKCVVIGLQSTGEARTLEQLEQNDGELSGFISTAKGVLESLIKRHFPTPNRVGMDWTIFDNDPTLPSNCRKRKQQRGGPMFQDEQFSSDSDDSSSADGDSAVESSSDEGEGGEGMEGVEEGGERESGDNSDSDNNSTSSDDSFSSFNPFGLNDESWDRKPKPKRRKTESSLRKGNFSIKPPPSSGGKGRGKTKTGFNSKSLKFEPVGSPKEISRGPPDRRQSVALAEGISRSLSSNPSHPATPPPSLRQQMSLQQCGSGQGEGSSLLNIMSSSAMSTGSNSGLRNVTVKKMKEELLRKLEVLSPHLPPNTLDELIDGLGGPSKVAEMTGRRGRVVSLPDGTVQYQLRSESDVSLEMLNLEEKRRFMDGDKIIAIISEAASSGISLQSDKRVKNHRRRLHITLELPWSADKAIQQFGRTHRSNQVNAPEYVFLISELSGEQRFASIVAKRLESLGALTHGDRRATESRDLSKYNVDTKYGRLALESVLQSVLKGKCTLSSSENYPEDFFDKTRAALIGVDLLTKGDTGLYALEKDSTTLPRFLNRLLGVPVRLQNQLFAYFTDSLANIIKKAKRTGSWDGGIRDFGGSGEDVVMVEVQEYVGDPAYGTATTQLHKIQVERGLSFSDAVNLLNTEIYPGEGFYISKKPRNDKHVAVLLKVSDPSASLFAVHRPNTGRQLRSEKLKLLQKKYTKVEPEEGEKWWNMQYESSTSVCSHAFWQGRCKLSAIGHACEVGLRRRHYYILSGSVLGVWTHLEAVLARHSGHNNRMQIARVHSNRSRLVGILIPSSCVSDMKQTLSRIADQAAGLGPEDTPHT